MVTKGLLDLEELSTMVSARKTIRVVTFDLWETLLLETDGASGRRASARCGNVARALNKFGLTVSVEQMNAAMKETVDSLVKV
jgi:ABC-type phosphonate transport system ATPase subunit